jgi:hypothetical protein
MVEVQASAVSMQWENLLTTDGVKREVSRSFFKKAEKTLAFSV